MGIDEMMGIPKLVSISVEFDEKITKQLGIKRVSEERSLLGSFSKVNVVPGSLDEGNGGLKESRKRKSLPDEDPDWSPEQGSDEEVEVKGGVGSAGNEEGSRRSRYERRHLEGLDYSRPIVIAMPALHRVKDLLEAFGWKILIREEGERGKVYVSPSGLEYGSLVKALEEFSHQAKKVKEEMGTFEPILDDGSSKGVSYASGGNETVPGGKEMLPIVVALPAGNVREADIEAMFSNLYQSKTKSKSGESGRVDCGGLGKKGKCHEGVIGSAAESRVERSESVNGTDDHDCSKFNEERLDAEVNTHKETVKVPDNKPVQQLETEKEKVKGGLLMPEERTPGQVNGVVALNERIKSGRKDESVNPGKKNSDCRNVGGSRSDQSISRVMRKDAKFRGVRRSTRINGRHVAVDSEWDLELADGECGFSSSDFVDLSKLEEQWGKKESNIQKNKKEMSHRLEKARFREVNELLFSCKVEGNIKSGTSNEQLMLDLQPLKHQPEEGKGEEPSSVPEQMMDKALVDMQPLKHEPDEGKDKEPSLVPEEMMDKAMLVVQPLKHQPEGKGKEPSPVPKQMMDKSMLDMQLLKHESDEGNDKEPSSVPEEMMDKATPVMQPLMHQPDEGKSKEHSSVPEQMMDKASLEKGNDDEPLSGSMEIMDRESGKRVPLQKLKEDKVAVEVVKSSRATKRRESCINDDGLEHERGDWSKTSLTKIKKEGDMHQVALFSGSRRSTRLNGRHVPVDDKIDIGTWAVDDYIHSSDCILKVVAEKDVTEEDKQGKTSSIDDNLESKSPTLRDMLFNKASFKKSGNIFSEEKDNKCVRRKTRDSEKCSPVVKKNGAKSLVPEKQCPLSSSKRKSVSSGRSSNGKKKKKKSGGCGLVVRRTGKSEYKENISSVTKAHILSWLIDTGTLVENEQVVYRKKNGKGNMLKGRVTRRGIRCNCCKKILSLLEFEAHAGSDLHQPWNNICVLSGMSLMQCQTVAWEKEKKQRKIGFQAVGLGDPDPSDETCGICADGGQLICCDGCPSTFHQDCLMLKSLPEGNWYCPFCVCAFCMLVDYGQANCVGDMELRSCNHCGCKYHIGCVGKNDKEDMGLDLESLEYCGKICWKVASGLSKMVGVSNSIGESFSWTLLRHLDEEKDIGSDQSKPLVIECNIKLSLALLVLHECFVPLVDPKTGLDMIAQAVYSCGSNFNRLNYEGFYTVILEKEEEIISVATLRFHGTRVAEMPFVGTRPRYRRQGMCRRLLNAIEEMLSSLQVEKLIIPAIPDLLETWMKSFSFKHLDPSHKDEIRNLNMVVFVETTLLQKSIYNKVTTNVSDEEPVQTSRCMAIQTCCSPDYGRQKAEVASLRLHEEIRKPDDDGDAEASPHSEVSNGSAFEVLPIESRLLPETGIKPTAKSVDIVVGDVHLQPGIVLIPNKNVHRWPQNADEAKDVCGDFTLLSIRR